MAATGADLANALLAARHDPTLVRGIVSAHIADHPGPTATLGLSVALCAVLRVVHKLCHDHPDVDEYLETTTITSHQENQ